MTIGAITFMVIFMLIVWGGLIVSALTLHRNNKKEAAAQSPSPDTTHSPDR